LYFEVYLKTLGGSWFFGIRRVSTAEQNLDFAIGLAFLKEGIDTKEHLYG